MHSTTHLLSLLSLLAVPSLASTTYGCWSDQSVKFHKDCMIAVSALVLSQTGHDDNAWIPPYFINYAWGNCNARIRGSDNGNVVPAINLLASFEQLGSRCQNGFFYYDGGWIDAELNGHAGFKREAASPERVDEAKVTWNTTEWVPHYNSKKPNWFPFNEEKEDKDDHPRLNSTRLTKRDQIAQYSNSAGTWTLLRTASVVIGYPPQYYTLVGSMISETGYLIDDAISYTGNDVWVTGVDAPNGSTVNTIGLALQLSTEQFPNWAALFNNFGDRGYVAKQLLSSAATDYYASKFTGAIYHIQDRYGNVVFSVMINGVTGNVGGFPSG
ncbi:hypothetical protein H072_3325 [Dactylellina haptotyla CBS 200.50]|uniref:Uncharacterized protein n=1 Tax=Dactylellina haptotyla (strain CBS 200.50) TaxID=1284197 RepID=S8C4N5_DACHA|nr:hypothetical protein H072_3325 [Dactylellina haptotyla CBS 200.50]